MSCLLTPCMCECFGMCMCECNYIGMLVCFVHIFVHGMSPFSASICMLACML